MIDPGLKGRVALVTEANRSVGAATARALALQGASVLLAFRGEPHAATQVEWIVDRGGLAVADEVDWAEPGAIRELFDHAEASFGPVSILVHAAGLKEADSFVPAGLRERDRFGRRLRPIDAERFDAHLAANARDAALLLAEFARRHVERGARTGCVVSVAGGGVVRSSESVSHAASQAALEALSRSAAAELGRYGIRVNVVRAGPFPAEGLSDEALRELGAPTPLGRLAKPEEVAELIVFLASEPARALTGQCIDANGLPVP